MKEFTHFWRHKKSSNLWGWIWYETPVDENTYQSHIKKFPDLIHVKFHEASSSIINNCDDSSLMTMLNNNDVF